MAKCTIRFDDTVKEPILLELFKDTVIECTSPTSKCKCTGPACQYIKEIIPMPWTEGDKPTYKYKYVSDRWCCVGKCGIHNRVYITCDYNILVSHDTADYDGAHLIILTGEAKNKLKTTSQP